MRHSTARLAESGFRLAQLTFPHNRVHVQRTRLAFIHLDNLLHFAKIDRDGRVDGYVLAYLPDELVLLFLARGELIAAVAFTEAGRTVVPMGTALKGIREEMERGELIYANAPMEQLAWMYESCAGPATPRFVDPRQPDQFFPALKHEQFTGVLELISNGSVNYFRFDGGDFKGGYFGARAPEQAIGEYVQSLFAPDADGTLPAISAVTFTARDTVPIQAPPALIQTYRELYWAIANAAEREMPGEVLKRAQQVRDLLVGVHQPLTALGTPLDRDAPDLVASPEELTYALSDWVLQLFEQLEIISPGLAPQVLKEATRDHRFVLQRAGFYERLPWTVSW